MIYTDEQFVQAFTDLSLPGEVFNHLSHVRLAWLYLQQGDFTQQAARLAQDIQRYATHLGAADKFHATLTYALAKMIHQRQQQGQYDSWQAFILEHAELVSDAQALVANHYSAELLASAEAKARVLNPDLAPL